MRFLGKTGYYRIFHKGFSEANTPVIELLKKGINYVTGLSIVGKCLTEYKSILSLQPVLGAPDFSKAL